MIKPALVVLVTALMAGTLLRATTYYVATNGNDSYSGTNSAQPFATPQKAVTLSTLAAGDLIYVRGGTYNLSTQVKPGKPGSAVAYIRFWAYPGELPVFDFATMAAGSTKALDVRKDYWHVKGFEVKNAPDSGIFIGGYSNIIEGCVVHDCNNDGVILGSTSVKTTNALILNCDSYRNFQVASGGDNGDGFAAKSGCGSNNVFRGCRSWYNSDDGWDFYDNTSNSVVLLNCWAFHNGTNLWGVSGFSGNGNGFKLGGAGTHARHALKQCLAFDNHKKGFDYNNSTGGHSMYNCTGFRNLAENYKFPVVPTDGTNTFMNDISYLGGGVDIIAGSVTVSNSWQGFTVTAADFVSLDTSLAFAPRNADYSLPTNGLARLAVGSQLIDKGVAVGLPFRGAAPDLGAYESGGPSWFSTSPDDLQWTTGGFRLRLNDLLVHGTLIIRAATNLNQTVWESISTNSPATNWLNYTDTSATNRPCRFYRAEEK
jgi:pectate disaccharide-lyase